MFPIFLLLLFSFPNFIIVFSDSFTKLRLPPSASGPESLAFALSGELGPYTGVADGRTINYQGPNGGFQDYAFGNPNRSKEACDGNTDIISLGPLCGRPLGLDFYHETGELFIADAYLGLLVVGTNGGLAKQIATTAEGLPFRLPDGLVVDQRTGIVYFTDASARFTLGEVEQAVATNDSTGRLLKYDPNTKKVTVLLGGLSVPGGVEVSSDSSYVLVTEFLANRIQKYWLKGPKANTSEILVKLPGNPDNIKRTASGDYLVAVNVPTSPAQVNVPTAIKINGFGQILASVSLSEQYDTALISEIRVFGDAFYIGSPSSEFIGKLSLDHLASFATDVTSVLSAK